MRDEPEVFDVIRLFAKAFLMAMGAKFRARFVRAVETLLAAEQRKLTSTPGPRDAGHAIRLANLRRFWEEVRR